MGRPRVYRTNADRQRAYRERLKAARVPQDPRNAELTRRVLAAHDKAMRGSDAARAD